ncbi:hypothetical protein HDU85_005545 [Gaertneriomyces sp. JEL0708]|nr:hypothetical protein HDU85_005545 [Gaertneriomyces sp. JEL0708]
MHNLIKRSLFLPSSALASTNDALLARSRDFTYFVSHSYAFVEFEDTRDAEDAYYEMQGRKVDGHPLNIQWAKNTPGRNWRFEPRRGGERSRSPPPRSRRASRSRSKSPRRRPSRSPIRSDREVRRRSRSPRDRRRDERDDREERRGSNVDVDVKAERSPMKRESSPFGNGRRSPSPSRRRGDSLSPRD